MSTAAKTKRDIPNGGAGTIEVVEIATLKVEHLYQRDLNADLVQQIAKNWDIVTAGTIVVSKRKSGDMYVVDGQHRIAGAVYAGETHILAQVIEGLTPEEEADLRIKGNVKRADRIQELFRARLFSGDKVARALAGIAEEFDTKINVAPDMNHGLNAIAAIEAIYMDDGTGDKLRRTFRTIKEAWGKTGGDYTSAPVLKGLTWFLDRHMSEIDYARLIDRLRTEGPGSIGRVARNYKAAMGGAMWLNTYRAIVEAYNYNLREQSRLEFRTNRHTRGFGGRHEGGGSSDSWR